VAAGSLADQIEEVANQLRTRLAVVPELAEPHLAMVLGSGLGDVVELLDPEPRLRILYGELPNVPSSSVAGHDGEVVVGTVGGRPVMILAGRVHAYEGYTHAEVTLLLRATFRLGIHSVLLTNAAGGMNPGLEPGDLMLLTDHINLSGQNPLTGANVDSLGPRFPEMTDAYDAELAGRAWAAAARAGVPLRQGVYLMLSGPSFETRAEMRMLRSFGADAVGMSTVHEVIVARHAGVRVLAISLITNMATPDLAEGRTHEEVMAMGHIGAARLTAILRHLLPEIA